MKRGGGKSNVFSKKLLKKRFVGHNPENIEGKKLSRRVLAPDL